MTGGLGFIGRRVAHILAADGHDVCVVDDPGFGAVGLRGATRRRVECHVGDVLLVEEWGGLLEGVDVVIHAAGIHQVDEVERNPGRHIEVNVTGTRRMLDAALARGVHRFVNLSTAKVYGPIAARADGEVRPSAEDDIVEPTDAYALGKVVAEQHCARVAASGSMEVTSLRPFSVFGPGQSLHTGYVGALLDALQGSGRVVLPGAPGHLRDFVHVDTVAALIIAVATAVEPVPPTINAGSGRATTLAELVTRFEEAAGRPLDVSYRDPRPGTLTGTLADVALMSRFTCPQTPDLSTGIRETIDSQLGLP